MKKTETTAEFIARGGQIKKVEFKVYKKRHNKTYTKEQMDNAQECYQAEMQHLPTALKIKYGIK